MGKIMLELLFCLDTESQTHQRFKKGSSELKFIHRKFIEGSSKVHWRFIEGSSKVHRRFIEGFQVSYWNPNLENILCLLGYLTVLFKTWFVIAAGNPILVLHYLDFGQEHHIPALSFIEISGTFEPLRVPTLWTVGSQTLFSIWHCLNQIEVLFLQHYLNHLLFQLHLHSISSSEIVEVLQALLKSYVRWRLFQN